MTKLFDTHFHFDFIQGEKERANFLQQVAASPFDFIGQTVRPSEFDPAVTYKQSLGFHPWWIESEVQATEELVYFQAAIKKTRFIGEVGLDFSPGRVAIASQDLQLQVFKEILSAVSQRALTLDKPVVMSIHAVRSSSSIIDLLAPLMKKHKNLMPIIHWFSGTSEELTRWLRLGGLVSINPQSLNRKKGRAYCKQIPAQQLLLETDLPSNQEEGLSFDHWQATMSQLIQTIHTIRGEDLTPTLLATQAKLYTDR